jgi:hypothetical protein
MTGQKEQAEVLRHGLMSGSRTVADVIAWADSVILADSQPDIEVIEIATTSRRQPADVSILLRNVAGECDRLAVIRRSMTDLRRELAADPSRGPQIARWLYDLATKGELPEGEFGSEAYALENWFALAASGTLGTYDSAVSELDAYLGRHARP